MKTFKCDDYIQKAKERITLEEGIYDPGIFKAVFMAGTPGGGKTTVANKLGLKALGLRFINSDIAFKHSLIKAGLPVFKTLSLL